MFTALFFFYTAAQLTLLAWLLRIHRETRAAAAAILLAPQVGLVWDNLIVALGSFIGPGDLLYWLSWPRFWIHWLMGAWLIVVSGSILRLAGFEWAQRRAVMVGFCLLTAAMMLYDLPLFFTSELEPRYQYDLVRYTTVVHGGPPLPQLVTVLVVLATGLALWIKRGFPWHFLGGLLMLVSATPPLMRLKLDNAGEVFIVLGALLAIWHFSRDRVRSTACHRPTSTNSRALSD